MRTLGVGVLAAALLFGSAACSKDEDKPAENDRGTITFKDPPKGSTDIGICHAYDVQQIKDLIGGDNTFKRLPPEAIGAKGDKVRGEACSWQRTEPNGDALNLRIEVRDYGKDEAGLATQFKKLEDGTISADPVSGLGDAAFSSESDETSLLQVRSGPYLVTLASRAEGGLKPVELGALQLLAASGLDRIK
jgi:hypothetical protein